MLKWIVYIGQKRLQPTKGDYSEWKEDVAKYCGDRCTYCCIHVSRYGGIDNFHVDHFRPKSKFNALRKSINNLFLACAICNRFKSDHWPSDPCTDHSVAAFPDPLEVDYNSLFAFNGLRVQGLFVASRYVVEQLYLNRPQLLRERRLAMLRERLEEVQGRIASVLAVVRPEFPSNVAAMSAALSCVEKATDCYRCLHDASNAAPYRLNEVRKPK
jgi:hypothetical protein